MHINTITRTVAPVKIRVREKSFLVYWVNFFHWIIARKISLLCPLLVACVSCSDSSPPSTLTSSDLTTTPKEIDFGSSQSTAQFSIASKNAKPVRWSMSANQTWVTLSDVKGVASKIPYNININLNRNNLSSGKKQAVIAIVYDGGQIDIPVSLFAVSESKVLANVKSVQTNVVALLGSEKTGSAKNPPKNSTLKNTTMANFVDNGALETYSKTVTLNISAEDHEGVGAYYIYDSDKKGQALIELQSEKNWHWKTINANKLFKGIVSYDFKADYLDGAEIFIHVWFKDINGAISSVAQDSIVFVSMQQQANKLASLPEKSSIPIQDALPTTQQNKGDLSLNDQLDVLVQGSEQANTATNSNNVVMGQPDNRADDAEDSNANADETSIFSYDFENGYNGWWVENGQWEIGATLVGSNGGCYNSAHCAATVLSGQYSDYIESRLIGPAISVPELGNNKRIQLKFFHWYALHINDLAKLQISVETSPSVWSEWKTLSVQSGYSRQWKVFASGLTNYANKTIRLGFYLYQPPDKAGVKEGWYIDDISIYFVH